MSPVEALRRRFRDLRLFWKLLLPLLTVLVLAGVAGAFLTVRFLSRETQADLDHDLLRRLGIADAAARDEGLYLLEAVRFGANLEGVPEAVAAGDADRVRQLVGTVAAARTKLDFLVATDATGTALVEVLRTGNGLEVRSGGDFGSHEVVARTLGAAGGEVARPGILRAGGDAMVAVAGPVGEGAGVVVAGIRATELVELAAQRAGVSLALFDGQGSLLARSDEQAWEGPPPPPASDAPVRRTEMAGDEETAAVYGSLDLLGERTGSLAVRLPTEPAFAAARGAAVRLLVMLGLVIAALVGLGALLSRLILSQVRALVVTNRALGRGDLGARAPVLGEDELGELARGMNLMAEQLDASQQDLERRVAERTEELERLYAELVQTSEGRSEAFAAISHELRNQLFVLATYAEELAESEIGRDLRSVTHTLQEQIEEILDLARLEARGVELELEDVLVQEVLNDLRPMVEALGRRGELEVGFDVPADLPPVRADQARLAQVVLNLVSNAVKYTPPRGSVAVTAAATGKQVEVSVADTGVGIPEEIGERLFEPFYRVSGSRPGAGLASSGLGLAITKRLVDAHRGAIGYERRPGGGTTFTVSLPAATRRSRPARRHKAAAPPAAKGNGKGNGRRKGNRRALRAVAATGMAAALVAGTAGESEARCVTLGADGVSHTQCGMP